MSVAVLGVVGARGGATTTTVASNLAALLARSGNKTLLVSTDPVAGPQRDLGARLSHGVVTGEVRPGLDLVGAGGPAPTSARMIATMRHGYDVVVVDASGGGVVAAGALAACDHTIVTTRPDAGSIAAARGVVETLPGRCLGVALVAVPLRPRAVLARSRRTLQDHLAGAAPTFVAAVRSEVTVAWSARERGRAVHELCAVLDRSTAEPATVEAVEGLARDLAELSEEVVLRLGA